tara:strand:- start:12020 stop:14614 length:2595 start_codon:yes stop_codon:yes gene_type:complete
MAIYEIRLLGNDGRQYTEPINASSQAEAIRIANSFTQESGARVLGVSDANRTNSVNLQTVQDLGLSESPFLPSGNQLLGNLQATPALSPSVSPFQAGQTTDPSLQLQSIADMSVASNPNVPFAPQSERTFVSNIQAEEEVKNLQEFRDKEISDINDKIFEYITEGDAFSAKGSGQVSSASVLTDMIQDGDIDTGTAEYWIRNHKKTAEGQEMDLFLKDPNAQAVAKSSEPYPAFGGWSKRLVQDQPSGNFNRTNGSGSNYRLYEYSKGGETVRVYHLVLPGEGNNFLASNFEIPVTPNAFAEGKGWSDIEYDDFIMYNNRTVGDLAEKGIPAEQRLLYSQLGDYLSEVTRTANVNGENITYNPYLSSWTKANEVVGRGIDFDKLSEANTFWKALSSAAPQLLAKVTPGVTQKDIVEDYFNNLIADPTTGIYLPSPKRDDIDEEVADQTQGFDFEQDGTAPPEVAPPFVDPSGIGQETGIVPGFAPGSASFAQTDIDPRTQTEEDTSRFVSPIDPQPEVVDVQPSANPGNLDELFNNFGIDTGVFGLTTDSLPGFPIDLFQNQDLFVDVTETEQIPNPSYRGVRGSGQPDEDGNVEFYQITNTRRVENPAIRAALDAYAEQLRAKTELQGQTSDIISQQIQSTRGMGVGADRLSPQELADLERNISLIGASEGLLTAPGQFEQELGDFRLRQLRESGRPQVQQTLAGIYSDPVAFGLATGTEEGRRFLNQLQNQAFQEQPFQQQQTTMGQPFGQAPIPLTEMNVDQPFGGMMPVSTNQTVTSNLSGTGSGYVPPSARQLQEASPLESGMQLAQAAGAGIYGEDALRRRVAQSTPFGTNVGSSVLAPTTLRRGTSADPFSGAARGF